MSAIDQLLEEFVFCLTDQQGRYLTLLVDKRIVISKDFQEINKLRRNLESRLHQPLEIRAMRTS